jgi:hypothetical protein
LPMVSKYPPLCYGHYARTETEKKITMKLLQRDGKTRPMFTGTDASLFDALKSVIDGVEFTSTTAKNTTPPKEIRDFLRHYKK